VKPADAKLQRWIDLLAALLRSHYGSTFQELQSIVPAYGGDRGAATIARMFERDKDELRALGIPIRVNEEETEDGTTQRYFIRAREMYLPYLALASATGTSRASVPPAGYRTLPTLTFEPAELSALLRAAQRAKSAGEPMLARDAASAIQKLTHDLGLALGAVAAEAERDAPSGSDASANNVVVLGHAMLRRKRVRFTYRSMSRDATAAREVEPYGLFCLAGHWYLAGRDTALDEVRNFRVSRMTRIVANTKAPQSRDYAIPTGFSLAEHARGREPWEIGEDAPEEMIAEFRGESGATVAARALGAEVPGAPLQRRFQVRRVDSFARWLMSFAGEAVPVSPERLRAEYHAMVGATRSAYAR
jgi:predicted DNA-binding transcriptional regulator YafY